jgi:Protein of unknown function (DUF1616)
MISESMEKRAEDVVRSAAANPTKLGSLLNSSTNSGVPRHMLARAAYKLRSEGKLSLSDPTPPRGLLGYARSPYGAWFVLVLVAVFATAGSIYLLPASPPSIYARYILGALMVLYLPGYSLIEALYPKKDDLDPLERLALSIGLSLALVPLLGLGLNYTPWGIRLDPIVASLSLLTIGLALAAAYRKLGYVTLADQAARKPKREGWL